MTLDFDIDYTGVFGGLQRCASIQEEGGAHGGTSLHVV